jgi:uncharacterized protein (DUF2336 family)
MLGAQSLIDELESSLSHGSSAQRADVLRRVTDLFLHGQSAYSDEHVALFDDVMCHLVEQIERSAAIRLSLQLAPVENPPTRTLHRLAQSDDIAISGPLIEKSRILSDDFLVDLAKTKSQAHLSAIAGRVTIAEKVTDVLVERGDAAVTLKVTGNHGARFSRPAFMKVVDKAGSDQQLAEKFVTRKDIPPDVFQHLLRKATEIVKQRLMRNSDPQMRLRINRTLAEVAAQVAKERAEEAEAEGHSAITLKHLDAARLRTKVGEYAQAGKRGETIDALAALSRLPTEAIRSLMREGAQEGLLILCKSVGLGWPDVRHVLGTMAGVRSEADLKPAFEKYINLNVETANRVIRFVKSCKAISKADLQRML